MLHWHSRRTGNGVGKALQINAAGLAEAALGVRRAWQPSACAMRRAELWRGLVPDHLLPDCGRPVLARGAGWACHRHCMGGTDGRRSPANHAHDRTGTILGGQRPPVAHDGGCRAGARRGLDGSGHILHANRLAEDLFGTRRRGGHIASMTRDPELLMAVDEALASRQLREVELHKRVPVERRLLATLAPLDRPGSSNDPSLADIVPRPDRAGSPGPHARRFRRQRQPRAAHAAGVAARLRRDAAGSRQERYGGARALPQGDERAGRAHEPPGR